MGQKVNPIGIRLGFTKHWKSVWYASKNYPTLLNQDINIRRDLKKNYMLLALAIFKLSVLQIMLLLPFILLDLVSLLVRRAAVLKV